MSASRQSKVDYTGTISPSTSIQLQEMRKKFLNTCKVFAAIECNHRQPAKTSSRLSLRNLWATNKSICSWSKMSHSVPKGYPKNKNNRNEITEQLKQTQPYFSFTQSISGNSTDEVFLLQTWSFCCFLIVRCCLRCNEAANRSNCLARCALVGSELVLMSLTMTRVLHSFYSFPHGFTLFIYL